MTVGQAKPEIHDCIDIQLTHDPYEERFQNRGIRPLAETAEMGTQANFILGVMWCLRYRGFQL